MRATIHLLGLELLSIELTTDDEQPEVQAYGDVRSEATADPGQIPSRDVEEKAGFR